MVILYDQFIDFIENRITAPPEYMKLNHTYFFALYRFISPMISQIDNLTCYDENNYKISTKENIDESVVKELLDSSSVNINHVVYTTTTKVKDNEIHIRLVAG